MPFTHSALILSLTDFAVLNCTFLARIFVLFSVDLLTSVLARLEIALALIIFSRLTDSGASYWHIGILALCIVECR